MTAQREAAEAALAPEKKGLPGWAWAAIGVGSVVIVGGIIYMISRRGDGGATAQTAGVEDDDPNLGFTEDELDKAAEAAA